MQQHSRYTAGEAHSLQEAFSKLRDRQVTDQQVRRVAVERGGEVHQTGKHRFFVYEANELHELRLEDDSKVPMVSQLQNSQFASEHKIISYRPGRRIVLGPAGSYPANILKGYKKRQAAKAAENHTVAVSACETGGFDVPELLKFDTGKDCLVMALRPGQPPQISLDTIAVWMTIGSHLRRFQQSQVAESLTEFNYQDEFAVLDERAKRFLLCMPALPNHWQEGCDRLEEVAAQLPVASKGLAHRDLHDGQFIITNETISLLDFDLICMADVALDAGNLLAHIKLRSLQKYQEIQTAAASGCSQAFLRGLGRQDEPGFEERLHFYKATTFYRLALLYALRPRWAHLTKSLINEGKRCMDEICKLQDTT